MKRRIYERMALSTCEQLTKKDIKKQISKREDEIIFNRRIIQDHQRNIRLLTNEVEQLNKAI